MPASPHDFGRPGGSSQAAGRGANDYDSFAAAYAADNEVNLSNAHYERPAVIALAGAVAGRRILDAGCGSGALAAALTDRGAEVTGTDSSAGLLALAARRLSGRVTLVRADLGQPLPFSAGAFDDVMASLVLHYLPDWGPIPTPRSPRARQNQPKHAPPWLLFLEASGSFPQATMRRMSFRLPRAATISAGILCFARASRELIYMVSSSTKWARAGASCIIPFISTWLARRLWALPLRIARWTIP